jgi:hypothetical protein
VLHASMPAISGGDTVSGSLSETNQKGPFPLLSLFLSLSFTHTPPHHTTPHNTIPSPTRPTTGDPSSSATAAAATFSPSRRRDGPNTTNTTDPLPAHSPSSSTTGPLDHDHNHHHHHHHHQPSQLVGGVSAAVSSALLPARFVDAVEGERSFAQARLSAGDGGKGPIICALVPGRVSGGGGQQQQLVEGESLVVLTGEGHFYQFGVDLVNVRVFVLFCFFRNGVCVGFGAGKGWEGRRRGCFASLCVPVVDGLTAPASIDCLTWLVACGSQPHPPPPPPPPPYTHRVVPAGFWRRRACCKRTTRRSRPWRPVYWVGKGEGEEEGCRRRWDRSIGRSTWQSPQHSR